MCAVCCTAWQACATAVSAPPSPQSRPRWDAAWPRPSSGACGLPLTLTLTLTLTLALAPTLTLTRCVRTRDGDVYQLGRQIETPEELALRIPDSLETLDLDSVGEVATAAVLGVRSPLVAVAAPAAMMMVGGIMVLTGGHIPHIHIPHVDVSVFIV